MAERNCEITQKPKRPEKWRPKREDASSLRLLGYYSVDGDRTFLPDLSKLLYFNPPKGEDVELDLDEGIQDAVRRDESFESEGIDHIIEWLKINHQKIKANPTYGRLLQPKFICTRGSLTRLMTTRSDPQQPWAIYAASVKGSIYMCCDRTKQNEFAVAEKNDMYSSWGYKFEQYVLSEAPDKAPDTSKPVLEAAEFRGIYQRRIGNHPVLFSAILKGVSSEKKLKDPLPLKDLKFVETKTSKILMHVGHEKILRKCKFLKWWAPMYLTDTTELLCGFRDEIGIVKKLKIYNIDEIVEMGKPYWNPDECIDFCKSFLTTIAKTVVNEYTETLYKFENIPDQGINIARLSAESQYTFIPESYVDLLG